MNLDNTVAFVTGGASGIGLGIARALAEAGCAIVLADVEASALRQAEEALQDDGRKVLGLQVDVTDRDSLKDALDQAIAAFGKVNILCNNAGVNQAGAVESLSFDDWDWVLGVNLDGVVNGVVTFLPELLQHRDSAYIVNTASVGGLVGMSNLAPYNTSKFAVMGLSEALRADLLDKGVGVSVLCPGVVATNLPSSARNRRGVQPSTSDAPQDAPDSPLRVLQPEEVGVAVRRGIETGEFYLCTHPEFHAAVAQRHRAIEAALGGRSDVPGAEAVLGIVRPF